MYIAMALLDKLAAPISVAMELQTPMTRPSDALILMILGIHVNTEGPSQVQILSFAMVILDNLAMPTSVAMALQPLTTRPSLVLILRLVSNARVQ